MLTFVFNMRILMIHYQKEVKLLKKEGKQNESMDVER